MARMQHRVTPAIGKDADVFLQRLLLVRLLLPLLLITIVFFLAPA